MVALIHHPAYAAYDFGPEHPFTPSRLEMLLDLLRALGAEVEPLAPPQATREDLLTVHDPTFVAMVEAIDRGAATAAEGEPFGLGTGDNPIFPAMDEAGRWLVGGTLHGARLLAEGTHQRVLQLGGGLHHAQKAKAEGFCLYNDLAVAIQALVDRGLRVAYLDIDLHHGDGVQNLFYNHPQVMTLSLHESGHYLYPGTGHIQELGQGRAAGLSVNVPLEPFTGPEDYLEAFDMVVPKALAWFKPQALVVQAGADAHFADPLGDLAITTQTFEALFRRILALAETHAENRLLVTLGGGYEAQVVARVWAILTLVMQDRPLPERLPEGWVMRWRHLLGPEVGATLHDPVPAYPTPDNQDARTRRNRDIVRRLMDSLEPFWF